MDAQESSNPRLAALYALFAVIIGVSFIGFLSGTSGSDYGVSHALMEESHADEGDHDDHLVPEARPYWELGRTPRGEGSGFGDDLARFHAELPDRTDVVDLVGTSKAEDLQARAARRAYDGAPPVIPHPVRQRGASECQACHENGVRIGTHNAPAYPHDNFTVCVQCHAMAEPNTPWGETGIADDPRDVPNSFDGLDAPTEGPRWSAITAPTIPHKTHMRERCDSCHGVTGRNAMRSTHPDRQNCEQCHAPNVEVEWRPGGLQ